MSFKINGQVTETFLNYFGLLSYSHIEILSVECSLYKNTGPRKLWIQSITCIPRTNFMYRIRYRLEGNQVLTLFNHNVPFHTLGQGSSNFGKSEVL